MEAGGQPGIRSGRLPLRRGRYLRPQRLGGGQHGPRLADLHWNGHAWKRVTSPTPTGAPPGGGLSGVAVTSASNAWAVGETLSRTLVEHWNGHGWKLLKNPAGGETSLDGVAAISPRNAWAVGSMWGVNPPSR